MLGEARPTTPFVSAGRDAAPEPDVVAAIRAGDTAAFDALYLAHHDALWRFANAQVHSAAAAEDVVQEVFLALWRDRATWEVTSSAPAWLFGAVRRQALKHLRHERVVTRLADRVAARDGATIDAAGIVARDTAPDDAHAELEARELDEAVARALAALPERRRLAMTLRWTHGLPAPEIARVLDTTPEAVRVLLTRARQELAALLRRLGG